MVLYRRYAIGLLCLIASSVFAFQFSWWFEDAGGADPYLDTILGLPFNSGDVNWPTVTDNSPETNDLQQTVVAKRPTHENYSGSEYCMNFDAAAFEYLVSTNEAAFDFETNDTFTVMCWIDTSAAGYQWIVSKMGTAAYSGWALATHDVGGSNEGVGVWLINTFGGGKYILVSANSAGVTDGNWYHIAFTYDGSATAAGVNIYVDGILQSMTTGKDTLTASMLNDIQLNISGRNGTGTDFPFDGRVDDVRIYTSERTSNQVYEAWENTEAVH